MAGIDSAAARRRQRRHRQFVRQERLSAAVALAESQHHTSRGQWMARGTRSTTRHDDRSPLLPRRSSGCTTRRTPPESVTDPRPQEQVQRHTVEHIVNSVRFAPMVRILDAPVPQMVEQLPDIMRFFDTLMPVPEQVIDVPKIFPHDVPMRTAVRDTQLAEQQWKCRRLYPFPCCSGLGSRTWTFQFLVVEGDSLVFKVFFPDRVQQRRSRSFLRNAFLSILLSRSLTFPVEVFKVFARTEFICINLISSWCS